MTLEEIIQKASDDPEFALVEVGCASLGLQPLDFCVTFASTVAHRFHSSELSWEDADGAMNALYFQFRHRFYDLGFPDLAYQVFLAFDDGEYHHQGDPPEIDPRSYTRAQINNLLPILGA